MDFDFATIQKALLNVWLLILSFSFHELGHAYMADRMGDDLPRSQGRLTLNPIAHIDPIGTIVLPLMGALGFFGGLGFIGWAKPVELNPSRYRSVADRAWVTIAGPAMNLILALVGLFGAAIAHRILPSIVPLFVTFMSLNVMLIVFNLLPFPPLDGSKFLMYWFGMSEETYQRFAQWSWILLLVLINLPQFRALLLFLYQAALVPFGILYSLLT